MNWCFPREADSTPAVHPALAVGEAPRTRAGASRASRVLDAGVRLPRVLDRCPEHEVAGACQVAAVRESIGIGEEAPVTGRGEVGPVVLEACRAHPSPSRDEAPAPSAGGSRARWRRRRRAARAACPARLVVAAARPTRTCASAGRPLDEGGDRRARVRRRPPPRAPTRSCGAEPDPGVGVGLRVSKTVRPAGFGTYDSESEIRETVAPAPRDVGRGRLHDGLQRHRVPRRSMPAASAPPPVHRRHADAGSG